MYRFIFKISIFSLVLLYNNVSLSMEVFDIQKFPEDIRRHIFVVAHPSIQNQLKNCSSWWHEIGAKKAPNMYRLLDNPSFRASHDDWCYIMMHAALDFNVKVMCKVLDRTDLRNFDYNLDGSVYKEYVFDDGLTERRGLYAFRLCGTRCIKEYKTFDVLSRLKEEKIPSFYIGYKERNNVNQTFDKEKDKELLEELDSNCKYVDELVARYKNSWTQDTPEKFKELDLESNLSVPGVDCYGLFDACFCGHRVQVEIMLDNIVDEEMVQYSSNRCDDSFNQRLDLFRKYMLIYDCFCIATCIGNKSCIKALSSLKTQGEPSRSLGLDLLFLAMHHNKQHIFRTLVKHNVYNCMNNEVSILCGASPWEYKATNFDEIRRYTNIPHINEFIKIYREFGGKTWKEVEQS